MKRKFLPALAISALLLSSQTYGQNKAFAVTGETKGNYTWNVVREIDLSSGEVIKTIYNPSTNKTVQFKAAPGSNVSGNVTATGSATGNGVAAAAYDEAHNRLYFTNMRGNELMYFDLNSSETTVVVDNNPKFNSGSKFTEGNVITRMAFASDGLGYALTNDGKSLISFTTDQKPTVTNLGELIDAKNNGTMSVHSQCSSWGGDMVGDAYGNLYLVTYRNHLYKINPKTRIADYLGQIKGLPAEFTSNGMVVDDNGDAVVTSATTTANYYRVNISTMEAVVVNKKEESVYNASDLANGNLLYQSRTNKDKIALNEIKGNNQVSIYPNPVPNKAFNVQFDKIPAGKYNLVLTDASGRAVLVRSLNIGFNGQLEKISLPRTAGGGMYMVKLTGSDNKVVYNDKIVVQ